MTGSSSPQRKRCGEMLYVQAAFPTEAAADLRRQRPDPTHWDREPFCDALLHQVHRLAGRPDRETTAAIDFGKRTARLHVHVMLRGSFEHVLDHHVALRPGGIDVAFFDAALPKHVAVRDSSGRS